jgi:hypothetical protein
MGSDDGPPDDAILRKEFQDSYTALQAIFAGWAKESPYGAQSEFGGGDYFIVDDFHRYHHKIYLWKWNMVSFDLIMNIRKILVSKFIKWDVMVQVLTDEMTVKSPIMGMIVMADGVDLNIAAQYRSTYLRGLDLDNINEMTRPD